uniref:AB hydrolase-1 domain-containing protein n=1 Tax=Rhizochromulina marina TaxID=1034831 RepID=A0A7S2S2P1_9STRA|mmetsp:Transcript_23991/g.70372  ORF Transcript_23991/g.70372 Transcript_23991/m.70372 type:complete len:501 (+) Transcript_23991:6-1508(+)
MRAACFMVGVMALRTALAVSGGPLSVFLAGRGRRGHSTAAFAAAAAGSREVEGETAVNGVNTRLHRFKVPLDHSNPETGSISVAVREVWTAASERADMPYLLYLQGGPGFPSGRPSFPLSGWQRAAAAKGYRVLLLDQRGTGLSSPLTPQSIQRLGGSPEDQATYLAHFRADSIVKDCEIIRKELCGGKKITLLGQSFGGFCILSYLSFFPEALERCYFTCGLAPVLQPVDAVYHKTFSRMAERNRRYYSRYPEDVGKVREISAFLHEKDKAGQSILLPSGGHLTLRRWLQSGLELGSASGMESLHFLVEEAWDISGECLSPVFLKNVEDLHRFDTNPIYWFLHEAIYMNGKPGEASQWSAARVQASGLGDTSLFDVEKALVDGSPVYFTGEMVYPWMAEDYPELGALTDTARVLANKADWGKLYDLEKLKNTAVPCAAVMSFDDVYVEREFSEETARLLGDNCKVWVTNEFQHSGLRDQGHRVFTTLESMLLGDGGIPS